MKKYWLSLIALMYGLNVFSQITINGTVKDAESLQALPGVHVFNEKSTSGTITTSEGLFTLEVSEPGTQIIFSYVGYKTDSFKWNGEKDIEINLMPNIDLEEIIILAIRAGANAPVAKADLDRKDIESVYVGQDVQYVLENTSPSIVSYTESGTNFSNYGQFRLRGIDQSRVNITLNGMPLNDMIDQGVFFSNFTDFSNNVQSVQIQRGVGTSTNGTASYAGSINFESINIRDKHPSADMELVGGSFGTYRISGAVKTGLMKNKLSFYSRFSAFNSDGYKHHTSTKSHSFYASGGYFGDYDLIKFTAFAGRSKNGLAYLPIGLNDIDIDPKTNYVNENDTDNFGQWAFQLQHTHLFNDQLALVSTAYVSGAGGDFPATFPSYDTIYAPGTPPYKIDEKLIQINYPLTNRHYGLMSQLNFTSHNDRLSVYSGLHIYTFRRNNFESLMPDNANPYYHEKSKKDEFSFFAKADYGINKFKFYGDFQIRTLSLDISPDKNLLPDEPLVKKNWTFFNPRIGITYKLDCSKNLFLSWGRNRREPTKIDILGGFQLNPSNLASVKSDEVRPESVDDIEAGIQVHGQSLRGQANLFYMFFKDEIAPIGEYVPEGFIQLRKNIPKSYRRGVEFNAQWDINSSFEMSGNATYMQSRIKEYAPEGDVEIYKDVQQPLSPEWMFSGNITYHFLSGFSAMIGGRYVGDSYQEPTNDSPFVMPAFFVANAKLSYRFEKGHTLDVFINNIFNTRYYTYGAPVDSNWDGMNDEPGYFVQPPRNAFAKLVLKF